MVSIKDVAKAAGVSTATVSRVLSNNKYVSEDVIARVTAAVNALNYRPSRLARSFRSQKSNIIGLIVADIQNPFFTSVSRAIEDAAYQNGLGLFLCNTDEKPDKEESYLEIMRDENVAGIIIAPTHMSSESIESITNLKIPTVVIDRRVENADIDSVYIDNVASAYALAKHCIEKGYRKIAAVIGSGSETGKLRHQGIMQAMHENGIKIDNEFFCFVNAEYSKGYDVTEELLKRKNLPEVILATNGLLGAGVFKAIKESGLSVPDKMGFACFDDAFWTTLVDPQVTVIQQPTYDIGQTAVELLMGKINDPETPAREIILKTRLIARGSTDRSQ